MITSTVPDRLSKTGLYTISEAARLMGVARKTVYNMIDDHRLKPRYRRHTSKMVIPGTSIIEAITGVF